MVRIRREIADPRVHKDFFRTWQIGGSVIEPTADNLVTDFVYIIESRGRSMTFVSLEQVAECLKWFKKKVHPSTRRVVLEYDFYAPWYCRIPREFSRRPNREKVVRALEKILKRYGAGRHS